MGASAAFFLMLCFQAGSLGDRVEAIAAEAERAAAEMRREQAQYRYEEARELQRRSREMVEAWEEFASKWNAGKVDIKAAARFERAVERVVKHPLWPKGGKRGR